MCACVYIYIYTYMHAITISIKRGYEFKGEQKSIWEGLEGKGKGKR